MESNTSSAEEAGRWNELAKDLFQRSGKRYFRSAKQCRERWNNYLDPTKKRQSWTPEEDLALVRYVSEKGKKWSNIAKQMQQQRTQHTVKNRYKSLFAKYYRTIPKSRQRYSSEAEVLQILEEQLVQQLAKKPEKEQKSSSTLAVEPIELTEPMEEPKKGKSREQTPVALVRNLSAFSKTRTQAFSKPVEQPPSFSSGMH